MTDAAFKRASDLSAALQPFAAPTKPCHWLRTPDGDPGTEWCPDCGHSKLRNLRKHDRKRRDDYILDGGWPMEQDSLPTCVSCGAFLRASLTAYGAQYELDHYLENGLQGPHDVDALYLSEILDSIDPEDDDFGEAIRLGSALLETIKASTGERR